MGKEFVPYEVALETCTNMNYKLLFLFVLLILTSCEKIYYKDLNVTGIVVEKNYIPAKDKYEYHYGYSIMKSKFCWHWGMNHHNSEYSTKINVDKTTYTIGYKNNYKIGDTIKIIKTLKIRDKDKKILDVSYSE
jgi:hypothetical protein